MIKDSENDFMTAGLINILENTLTTDNSDLNHRIKTLINAII